MHLLLTAAKANNRQAYVVRDANGSITDQLTALLREALYPSRDVPPGRGQAPT